ncbi:ARM repeat-containing protein [Basidiobolus meristosporus CBS 931.73]|uniref:ARM repeat-containing protein n=1 Tax=Basidiobolus meristosporus CBS 931.73 TaxID=1314790 RepID=A0A1Y1XT71_9FUNG|nr:ARM repeat-containing protein [Basidiobolus meristosporus CBS 931.73]|eukprot:ORX88940.1 ARM repeat-containing protein [Basidiobolus meristosporus CBS 931.73]
MQFEGTFETSRLFLRLTPPYSDTDPQSSDSCKELASLLVKDLQEWKEKDPSKIHWKYVKATEELFADWAKQVPCRSLLSEAGAIEISIHWLNSAKENNEVRIQCLRALANICIDHDDNRQRTLESKGITAILDCFNANDKNQPIAMTCVGALLNISMRYAPVIKEIIAQNGLKDILSLFHPGLLEMGNSMTVMIGVKVLSNLLEEDEGVKAFEENQGGLALLRLLKYLSVRTDDRFFEVMEPTVEILAAVIVDNVQESLFEPLLSLLEIEPMDVSADDQDTLKEIQSAVTNIVIEVGMSDVNLEILFEKRYIMKFINWLSSSNPQLQMCGGLCLANLARTGSAIKRCSIVDAHCTQLVQEYKITPVLLELLKSDIDVKVQHALIGIIKNLCLPSSNKATIGSLGAIRVISSFVESDSKPIQFSTIVAIKHLCAGNLDNGLDIIQSYTGQATLLEQIIDVVEKTDNPGICSEGTRILINLIRLGWGTDHSSRESDLATLRNHLTTLRVVTLIGNMIKKPKFPLLQNEGIVALTLLTLNAEQDGTMRNGKVVLEFVAQDTTTKEESPEEDTPTASEVEILPFFEALNNVIQNVGGNYPTEMSSNASALLARIETLQGSP